MTEIGLDRSGIDAVVGQLEAAGGSMITVEAKKVGTRMIATVKVGIGTGRFTYTVQFADQGSEAANEAEAQRELRKTLEEVLEALGPS